MFSLGHDLADSKVETAGDLEVLSSVEVEVAEDIVAVDAVRGIHVHRSKGIISSV
jgi:hypothetical protein